MAKMRQMLVTNDLDLDIITYDCSAHLLNYYQKILKYLGKALVLPQDVRWNTLADSIQSYIENWPILYQICHENRIAVSNDVLAAVENINKKNDAQEYLVKLKKISIALDQIQSDSCTICEVTSIWINLKEYFESEVNDPTLFNNFLKMYKVAITPYHVLSYILDHHYQGQKITEVEMDNTAPLSNNMFTDLTKQNVTLITWWLSVEKRISSNLFMLTQKMFTAVASSPGIE
ncbi:hypothetical protein AGLY_003456 [Aphis glycines]|uniref:HAT C-terminal dimerisation domain-containing protein n=1 Tax=Aphis glycines TaxID=307491 RepID=A0A6G0U128_APHGL|nr:hypothetical protein AGLY_003456 [Aphis glycines]